MAPPPGILALKRWQRFGLLMALWTVLGLIDAGQFYVQGTHEMSFDSRYRVNGLVRREQIIGKATVIF